MVKISSQSGASRGEHLRDFDSLVRRLGVADREGADLTKSERRMIVALVEEPELSERGAASLRLLDDGGMA